MKKSTQKTVKKQSKLTAPKIEIHIADKKAARYQDLVDDLSYVTEKIKRLPDLLKRLPIEAPDVQIETIFKRLKKKRHEIKTKLQSYKSGEEISGSRKQRLVSFERALISLEEWLRRQQASNVLWPPPYVVNECPSIEGFSPPILSQEGSEITALRDINHNSTYSYGIGATGYDNYTLYYMFLASLNDDAAWWRDDDPDHIGWFDGLCFFMPEALCDCLVRCDFYIKCEGEVMSTADDYNKVKQYIYVAWPDENGNLPPSVSFGSAALTINNFSNGPEFSGSLNVGVQFKVKRGVSPCFVLANCTELKAQDGELAIKGNWTVSGAHYRMIPL